MQTKAVFYRVRDMLKRRERHVARIALGSAFEGWLNAEIGREMRWGEPNKNRWGGDEYVVPESQKRDLVVFRDDGTASHVIEVKLVYPWSERKMLVPLKRLYEQISRKAYNDETTKTRYVGFIFGVWISPFHSRFADRKSLANAYGFYQRLTSQVRAVFDEEDYTFQHRSWRRAVDCDVTLNGEKFHVEVGMLHMTRRPQSNS